MLLFLDTEFMENGAAQTVKLLSVAIVSEDGRYLYLVVTDAPRGEANDFVRDHVLPHIDTPPSPEFTIPPNHPDSTEYRSDGSTYARVPRSEAGEIIRDWVAGRTPTPEFWTWYGAYDWVALCQLFGNMTDLPADWPMYACDLRTHRAKFPDDLSSELPHGLPEHHALADAYELRARYQYQMAQHV